MGICSGVADKQSTDSIAKLFLAGCKDILSAALVVGLASGIIFTAPSLSRARHSRSPTNVVILTRCMSALPSVAVVSATKRPTWFSTKATFCQKPLADLRLTI